MRKVQEAEQKNVNGGITKYFECPKCGMVFSAWSLLGIYAQWRAERDCRNHIVKCN